MELLKKNIHNYTEKISNMMQFTIDDTQNVPDNLMDMERLVLVKGNVFVEEIQAMVDRFQIKGYLSYQILYSGSDKELAFDSMSGQIPFVEYINAEGTEPEDGIDLHISLSDMTVSMLHSRKISIKALVSLDYCIKGKDDLEVISEIECFEEDEIKVMNGKLSMMTLQTQDKKTMNLSKRVEIPTNKPDIYQVIWKSMIPTMVNIKPMDDGLVVTGNLNVFLVYTTEEELPLQYFTLEIPFEEKIELSNCNEDMISVSTLNLDQYSIIVSGDVQGKDRMLNIDGRFTLDIKLYGIESLDIVKDVYATKKKLLPICKEFNISHLLLRNCAKVKIMDVVTLPNNHSFLQVCNVEGAVTIDEVRRTDYGIIVDGVVGTQVTYFNKEAGGVLSSQTFDIPFSNEIEIPGIGENVSYSVTPFMEKINGIQIDDNSLELKAEVTLDVLAFSNDEEKAILDITEEEFDEKERQNLPSMIGYIVKKEDTLWSIAKAYYTTVEKIKESNELASDNVEVGDKLLIIKN